MLTENNHWKKQYETAVKILEERGQDIERVKARLMGQHIELPSWGFNRGGTRFGSYIDGTEPETIEEKMDAAGTVNRLTGVTPTVALHIPWDGKNEEEWQRTLDAVQSNGLKPGSINCNTFQQREEGAMDHRLRDGSLTNPDPAVREATLAHVLDCIQIMRWFESDILTVWLHDGTNSPGQMSLYQQTELLDQSFKEIYNNLDPGHKMLIEYKIFEPAFYATAIADWGRSYSLTRMLGDQAYVLVDTGHHPHVVNLEQIVTNLIHFGKLGGFHFNDRKYADDDLVAGSIQPFQLFLIYNALVEGEERNLHAVEDVAYMVDQSHNVKAPTEAMLETVENIQRAFAQALVVDRTSLNAAYDDRDTELADQILREAFYEIPVHAIIKRAREEAGLPVDPLREYRELSGTR